MEDYKNELAKSVRQTDPPKIGGSVGLRQHCGRSRQKPPSLEAVARSSAFCRALPGNKSAV